MRLRPLNDQILVRREKPKETSDGGTIYLPETARLKSRTGEVLAVGTGAILNNGTRRPILVEVGQVVYFRGTHGTEIRVDDEDLVLLKEDEIDGVVER